MSNRMKVELTQMQVNVIRNALEREIMYVDNELDKANDGGPLRYSEGIAWKAEIQEVLGKLTKAEAEAS